jgi:hypothetical protein
MKANRLFPWGYSSATRGFSSTNGSKANAFPAGRQLLLNWMAIPKLAILVCLLSSSHALAVATYDYLSDVALTFNYPWSALIPLDTLTTSGAGQHQESANALRDAGAQILQFFQRSEIVGSAGDDTVTEGGVSHAYSQVVTLLTFAFGFTPTDLTVTLASWNQNLESSRELPLWNPINQTGEYVGFLPGWGGGGTALQFAFDGKGFWGSSTTFDDLTGEHTLSVMTIADETAFAAYSFVPVSDSSNTLLVLAAGLLGLANLGNRTHRARR